MSFPSLATRHSALTTLPGVPKSAEALALADLLQKKSPRRLLHIAAGDRDADSLEAALKFFAPEAGLLRFPAWDTMPYDRASPRAALMAERMRTLVSLPAAGAGTIILTTANAVTQKLPPPDALKNVTVTLRAGEEYRRETLVEALIGQGYRRAGKAMESGEFALRGSLMDIVAPGMAEGLRLDFFGDMVESIKPFDPMSQRTCPTTKSDPLTEMNPWKQFSGGVNFLPVSEIMLNEDSCARFRERYRERFGAVTRDDPLYESISQKSAYPGMEHWLPLFYDATATLLDYCDGALVTLGADAATAMEERWESIEDYYQARLAADKQKSAGSVYHPLPPQEMFVMKEEWERVIEKQECMMFSPFTSPERGGEIYQPLPPLASALPPFEQLQARQEVAKDKKLLIACFSNGSRQRMQTLLAEHGFISAPVETWQKIPSPLEGRGNILLAVLPLETGFETPQALILSEQDILGERIMRAAAKKKKSEAFFAEAAGLVPGELVAHKEHGIGRFEGLAAIEVMGAAHDCLKLIYDGGDKLFLPVENLDMVARYGEGEEGAKLDKLGGAAWQARKARLKAKLLLSAEALLKIAAERALKSGAVMEAPDTLYDEFAARFPYMETEDQARAIAETLEDLRIGKPMDRLICGDVGFGKTEVALRAAFVAACGSKDVEIWRDGDVEKRNNNILSPHLHIPTSSHPSKLQVALICPTTLLARQHYQNFKKRFAGLPVKLAQLSRIVPAREQAKTREGLKSGEIDIVIGTHALLSKNVQFKNLGLLIVDEEQHFGVAQKEKLKELKSGVHVLTLSATPIPRTLQMALAGVRDLSLITTPPVDRLAVRSFVMPFDPVVIREALMRERHRGGKSFVVAPRIKDLGEIKAQMAELMPEAKLAVAHGQMPAAQLDSLMNDFYDGKYDILISTAIIESGLDIEAANTMIIFHAQQFGLAQLYQLRGRVGRGKQRAYAYFLLPNQRLLSKNATRRLEVMQTLDSLGAGFTLASHDMDIRGFGNLVGEEQSGHIREVGIELYQQMLEEAVSILRRGEAGSAGSKAGDPAQVLRTSQDWSPQINLGLAVLIPESYVENLELRLSLYRRAANLSSEEDINGFAAELVDRFGKLPPETETLIATLGLKLLCKKAGIERVDLGPKGAVISFRGNTFANPGALIDYVAKNKALKIRPDQKIVLAQEWKSSAEKLAITKKLAGDIAELAQAII